MVINPEFKPSHCTQCRKEFGKTTTQYETPFSDDTEMGADWDDPDAK
jgi:hypothetical protein